MAKRRRHTARKNPARRRHARRRPSARHRARRNPPSFLGSGRSGIIGSLTQGAKDATLVVAGKAATNFASRMIPTTSALAGVGARVASALAIGLVARRFMGADSARFVIAGGLAAPIEAAIKAANVPLLSGALASDEEIGSYYERIGSYVEIPGAINRNGVGDGGNMMDPQYQHASGF